jgi:hypothetical protein
MPKLRTENFGTGDARWLRSDHGIWNGRTEVVDISTFTAGTHYPNGYIPQGTPVALVGGMLVPYDSTEATVAGAGVLAGHILTDQPILPGQTADFPAPLLDHGRVNPAFVPVGVQAFTVPVAAAKRASTTIVYR